MISVGTAGSLLLNLYRASREMTMEDFQRHALAQLRPYIQFDAAVWAMATRMENGREHVHDSFITGMPDDCAELMNLSGSDNLIAKTCSSSPGTCFYFSPTQIFADPQTAMMARYMDVAHVLCIAWRSPIPQLSTILSLARRDGGMVFSEDERCLCECLMPHLTDMLQVNVVMQISAIRARDSESRSAMAVVDAMGMLLAAEPGLERLLHLEWPDWDAPSLPAPLLASISEGRERYLGAVVQVRFEQVRESRLVTVARRSPGDLLSPRERTVAEGFAKGESYKELAKRLGLSPATVRHHLRAIYEKLGVADKAALATLMSTSLI